MTTLDIFTILFISSIILTTISIINLISITITYYLLIAEIEDIEDKDLRVNLLQSVITISDIYYKNIFYHKNSNFFTDKKDYDDLIIYRDKHIYKHTRYYITSKYNINEQLD